MTLDRLRLPRSRRWLTRALVFDAVRDALIAHAEGRTQMPAADRLDFPEADGDCHVKAGHLDGAPHFAVKVAQASTATPSAACRPTAA